MTTVDEVFSVIALFVLYRETVEAAIVVAILLQLMDKLNRPHLKRWVWYGVISAVSVSILIGVGFIIAFYSFRTSVFIPESPSAEMFAGIVAWVAAIIITILAFAMLRFLGWEDKWRRRLDETTRKVLALQKDGATDEELAIQQAEAERVRAEADRKDAWKAFLAIFLTTLREGIEAVVLLAGVGNDQPTAIPLPAFIGIVLGVLTGMFLYYSGKMVKDLKIFFIIMTIILLFLAAGQIVNGIHSLDEGGYLGGPSEEEEEEEEEAEEEEEEEAGEAPPSDEAHEEDEEEDEDEELPWYLKPLWNTVDCCGADPEENKFFALLHAIFGYQDKGQWITIITYFGYWAVVIAITIWKWRRGSLFDADFKHTQAEKQRAAEQAALDAQMAALPPLDELKMVVGKDADDAERQSSADALASPPPKVGVEMSYSPSEQRMLPAPSTEPLMHHGVGGLSVEPPPPPKY